ncbi:hypothetical protein ACQ86N_17700 [Puia sp. P3]|uniref:hypothetical protein n=1 Tax=Puia sp. P3 TaxID=3423952 RepID=UPI003D6796FC
MDQLTIKIDAELLSQLLRITFEKLPDAYLKALKEFLKSRSKSYFRESLISQWISIPTGSSVIFRDLGQAMRFAKIFVETIFGTSTEIQIYINRHGIFGLKIKNNLEDLIFDTIDTDHFILESLPISKFYIEDVDMEGFLNEFQDIDDFLDNEFSSEKFNVNGVDYFSIICLSDKSSIVVDNKKKVYVLNKDSGQIKLLSSSPIDFINSFKKQKIDWLGNIR